MIDQERENRRDLDENADATETWDGVTSPELFKLRALSTDPERLTRDTMRILVGSDIAKMDESDFAEYVVSTINSARSLILQVLERTKDAQVHITDWSTELSVDNGNFDVQTIRSYVSDRINSIDTLELLSLSTEASGDFDAAKQLLERVQENLRQWNEVDEKSNTGDPDSS